MGISVNSKDMAKTDSKRNKNQIPERVKEGKETVVEIARQHAVKVNTVYGWIGDNISGVNSSTLENNRLKRENRKLKEIIGSLILQSERGKN